MDQAREVERLRCLVDKLKVIDKTGISEGTPASAAAAGVKGQIRWDANYFYVCVATNTWVRYAKAAW